MREAGRFALHAVALGLQVIAHRLQFRDQAVDFRHGSTGDALDQRSDIGIGVARTGQTRATAERGVAVTTDEIANLAFSGGRSGHRFFQRTLVHWGRSITR